MNDSIIYQAVGLKKSYDGGTIHALRGVDLTIHQGEFIAIIGQSGSGKSTLLQMFGALDNPSEGTLSYKDQCLISMRDKAAYRAKEIGFIFQSFHLLNTFTSAENVQIPMFESKRPGKERRKHAEELLTQVGLQHRLDHLPSKLSGGERQRVAIARSLANHPSVLLADEPTGNLDSESAAQVLDLLIKVHRERSMTMVLITHDMEIAKRASRTVRIKDGMIISDDPEPPSK